MTVPASQPILKETNEGSLAAVALKDPQAFEIIYHRWISPVYRYLYARTGNAKDAEDLTSQVFLSIYQSLSRYRHNGNFVGWMFTIARNLASQWLKKTNREVLLMPIDPMDEPYDPLKELIHDQELFNLRKLVTALREDERDLIYLRYVAGLSFPEIAKTLKRPEAAVKKSLYRLQARLYRSLEENND
jgi:RNA polymerase sigma-70 factor (ECF subfamily)